MMAYEYNKQILQQIAARMGLRVALMWSFSFLVFVSSFPSLWCELAYVLGFLSLVFVGVNLRGIRRFVMPLSWFQGWTFTLLSFMGGMLITTLVQIGYFAFLDKGHFLNSIQNYLADENLAAVLKQAGTDPGLLDQMKEAVRQMQEMPIRQLVMSFFSTNISMAFIASLIASLFGGKKVSTPDSPKE